MRNGGNNSKANVDSALECGIKAICVTGDTIKKLFENELELK